MRVLIASTGGSGHFGPLEPFAGALAARGEEVLLVVPPELEAAGARLRVPARRVRAGGVLGRLPARPREEQALLGNREWFGRLCTAAMRPAMDAAFDDFAPELVLRDPCDFASAIAADARARPVRHDRVLARRRGVDVARPDRARAAGRDRGRVAGGAVPDPLPGLAGPAVLRRTRAATARPSRHAPAATGSTRRSGASRRRASARRRTGRCWTRSTASTARSC